MLDLVEVASWGSAAPTHLKLLDKLQNRAPKHIGEHLPLQGLGHRRNVAALSYLYKLLSTENIPPKLNKLIPPKLLRPSQGRTRQQVLLQNRWHEYKLDTIVKTRSIDVFRRSFPWCIIDKWNSLPKELFENGIHQDNLQTFKRAVHENLISQNV